MADIIKTDGKWEKITDLSLESLQKAVGGSIEYIYAEGSIMIVNEEGSMMGLPMNKEATELISRVIVGNVVFGNSEEFADDDEED